MFFSAFFILQTSPDHDNEMDVGFVQCGLYAFFDNDLDCEEGFDCLFCVNTLFKVKKIPFAYYVGAHLTQNAIKILVDLTSMNIPPPKLLWRYNSILS